ncbi:hypothetical protein [Streptomyces antibioticus]|uniref:hypothetical protein n=1 Tax=Streptomyces antibioticus TaxID=1890 RepID=UPI0036F9853F
MKLEIDDDGELFRLTAPANGLGEHPYDRYRVMYVGGVAAPVGVGLVPADPSTYDGNPQSLVSP